MSDRVQSTPRTVVPFPIEPRSLFLRAVAAASAGQPEVAIHLAAYAGRVARAAGDAAGYGLLSMLFIIQLMAEGGEAKPAASGLRHLLPALSVVLVGEELIGDGAT